MISKRKNNPFTAKHVVSLASLMKIGVPPVMQLSPRIFVFSSSLLLLSSSLSTPLSLSEEMQIPRLWPSDLVAFFWGLSLHLNDSVSLKLRALAQ